MNVSPAFWRYWRNNKLRGCNFMPPAPAAGGRPGGPALLELTCSRLAWAPRIRSLAAAFRTGRENPGEDVAEHCRRAGEAEGNPLGGRDRQRSRPAQPLPGKSSGRVESAAAPEAHVRRREEIRANSRRAAKERGLPCQPGEMCFVEGCWVVGFGW